MAGGGLNVSGIGRNPWAWAIVSSLVVHGFLLGTAYLFISHELPRPRQVVPVETVSLIPGRPGLCGGHRGMAAPADKPKSSSPKTKARKAPPPAKPKPVKTAPQEQKFRPETPPTPPSLALLRPVTPEPSREVRSAGSPTATGASASAGVAPGSSTGTGVGQGAGRGGGNRGSGTGGGSSLSSYLQQVKRLLEQHKNYPPAARRQHLEGVVVLRFTIAASGKIESANLSRSSGHGILDLAAQETLKRVSKFPPLPADLERPQITVEVPLAYRLMAL